MEEFELFVDEEGLLHSGDLSDKSDEYVKGMLDVFLGKGNW